MTIRADSRRAGIAVVAVILVSAVYYGLYIDAGFNSSDDGNYAQIAYELLLGRKPQDIAINYGLLWFKIGEGLFRLFGVNFLLVRGLFFACILLTNVLVFCTLLRISGRIWYAAVLVAVTLIAPAFPATAFYGLCIALNAAAQIRFASRLAQASPWDAALAGAALGITFQVRPDFGVAFIGPLIVLVLLTRPKGRIAFAALAGFIGASLPFFICALVGGYTALLVQQYLDYPALLVEYLLNGLRGMHGTGGDIHVLQRPSLGDRSLAMLVYGPVVFIAVAALFVGTTLVHPRDGWNRVTFGQALVALVAGLAAFPHYFLFRPDLAHVANFMPGFIVMAGVLLVLAWQTAWSRTVLAPLSAVGLSMYVGLYVWTGLSESGTGSINARFGSTKHFHASNGVNVRLTPTQRARLEFVRTAIEAHSAPGDAIVCLPYCPGYAFMTGRRMLLSTFYADEAFLVRKPLWLDETIALTQAARPPIVIVADWAINGTEQSRFVNWAARYVAAVDALAQDRIKDADMTIYVLKTSTTDAR